MEMRDVELIRSLSATDRELKKLWETHQTYEEELAALDRRPVRTPQDDRRKKELQKRKLAGKDRMTAILARHRRESARARRHLNGTRPPDLSL